MPEHGGLIFLSVAEVMCVFIHHYGLIYYTLHLAGMDRSDCMGIFNRMGIM